jgi:hypothetical protein
MRARDEKDVEVYDSEDEEEGDEDPILEENPEEDEMENNDAGLAGMFGTSLGENKANVLEKELEGDQIKERILFLCEDYFLIVKQLRDAADYPSTHLHLRELPALQINNSWALLDWAKHHTAVDTTYVLPTTWGSSSQGIIYK